MWSVSRVQPLAAITSTTIDAIAMASNDSPGGQHAQSRRGCRAAPADRASGTQV